MGTFPASGNAVAISIMNHFRIADGRIAEVWEVGDRLALLQQIGALPTRDQS